MNTEVNNSVPPQDKQAKGYYESDDAFRYYCILYNQDYTGAGFFPEEKEVTCFDKPDTKLLIGSGCEIYEAVMNRDKRMVDIVLNNFPEGKKLRILELGSGRGGLTRYMAKELIKRDMLDKIVAGNIAPRENELNLKLALEQGIPAEKFEVIELNFDNMDGLIEPDSYDFVFSNDAFNHCSNYVKLMKDIHSFLKKDGIVAFSDMMESEGANPDEMVDLYKRLRNNKMPNATIYNNAMTEAGMSKIDFHTETHAMMKHYGAVKYAACVTKREELLGPRGVS